MKKIKLWLTVITTLLIIYVAWLNNESVVLQTPWPFQTSFETSSVLAYLAFFVVGFILAMIYFGITILRLKMQIRKLNKELKQRPTTVQTETVPDQHIIP